MLQDDLLLYTESPVPTQYGRVRAVVFRQTTPAGTQEHLALVTGAVADQRGVLTRVHSECLTGEVLRSLKCDCGEQLDSALRQIAEAGRGVVLYLRQEGRGIGLGNKIRAYALQEGHGLDTIEANRALGFADDLRDFSIAARMLEALQVRSIALLTNNPEKADALQRERIQVERRVPMNVTPNPFNRTYLRTKNRRMGHLIPEDETLATQIYCRRPSPDEMAALIAQGVTHLAWTVTPDDGPLLRLSFLLVEQLRAARVRSTILVTSSDIEVIASTARMLGPDLVLIPAERIGRGLQEADLPRLADRLAPRSQLMMSVPVRTAGSQSRLDSRGLAQRYQGFAGCLILDTALDDEGAQCGCTGRTNDWALCRDIVAASRVPVMLAGGLSPDNVAAAVAAVRPWGVDACSALESSPGGAKDLQRCQLFLERAAAAHAQRRGAGEGG